MVLTEADNRLIAAIQEGLPLTARPYADIAGRIGLSEQEVLDRVGQMQKSGIIKRMGIVVRHRELGYTANAMVVWDVPDGRVDEIGRILGGQICVNLCYQRPRRLPAWPYNMFCMIHGKSRRRVLDYLDEIVRSEGLEDIPRKVLFSSKCFKQRGARYR